MLPTHALAGMLLGLGVAVFAPEVGGVAVVAGLLGGVLPDLDMYSGHRKTLHFPVYYTALTVPAALLAVVAPSVPTVFLAVLLAGAALHSASDALGGGLEPRPWEATSDQAVYDHYNERWIAPRRVVGYDGSPGDLLLSAALGVPLLLALDGPFVWVVVLSLVVATVYTAVRRVLPTIARVLVAVAAPALPRRVVSRIPRRYRPGGRRHSWSRSREW